MLALKLGKLSSLLSLCKWSLSPRNMSASPKITFSKIKQTDSRLISDFCLKNFFIHEPIGVVLGLEIEKEVRPWFHKYVKEHMSHSPPVSVKAVDDQTGEVIGIHFSVVVDPTRPKPPSMGDFVDPENHPTMHKICSFFGEIEEGLDAAELLGIKSLSSSSKDPKYLDNLIVSVNNKYWNRGIARDLVRKSEELASKVKRCQVGQVITTSAFSYKIFSKQGYQAVRDVAYAQYTNADGVQIFMGKEEAFGEHANCRIMMKDLSVIEADKK